MNYRILIAEDEPRIREVLCDFFLSRGDIPVPAADGKMALQLAESQEFDGVLLDIMMPKLDGLAVCRCLRKRSDVPIIFLRLYPVRRINSSVMNWGRTIM